MPQYIQGDIVLLPFPYSDLSAKKVRPAIIISNSNLNSVSDIVVLAISSKKMGDENLEICIDNCDLEIGNLPLKSYVKIFKIINIHSSIVIKKVAHLKKIKLRTISSSLKNIINI